MEELLESKRDLITNLAERLLEKESISLPQIIEVLGDRPFEMKQSIKDYLSEMLSRQAQEAQQAEADKQAEEAKQAETAAAG